MARLNRMLIYRYELTYFAGRSPKVINYIDRVRFSYQYFCHDLQYIICAKAVFYAIVSMVYFFCLN
jgi:hypothetical protein